MGSSREQTSAGRAAVTGVASPSLATGAEATVISGQPPVGPLSMAEIGRVLEGHRLGAYQLERFIGGGGMGAVFRALDTTLDRIVAVKVLARQQSADEEMLKRFRNEAQSAARLDHENIGRVHAVGSEDGWHFIVFEYIEGTNLRDLVRAEGAFDTGRAINVTIQVADALEHASARDVVHRDIKPSNIIITPTGRARLVDMGLARLHVEARDDLTSSGMTLGTFDYISPEQARDPRSADVRSDLYSLGCTVFFMLAGRPPFADGTMVQKLLQHQQEPPPSIEALRPDVPRRFAAAIARLMAKDPADRYQRPTDLVADLLGIADEEGIDVSASRSPGALVVEPSPPVRRRRLATLPWLLPVVALGALVAWLWWTSPAARRKTPSPAVPSALAVGMPAQDAAAESPPWRVVETPAGDREAASLADAVRRAGPGAIIELAYDGVRDEPALPPISGELTVRAAPGRSPGVRLASSAVEPGTEGGSAAAWPIASGTLSLERVRVVFVPGDLAAGRTLFALGAGATLVCEDCLLDGGGADETAGAPVVSAASAASSLIRAEGDGADATLRTEVRISRTEVRGAGGFLHVVGSRHVDVIWFGGRCVLADTFAVAEGGERADGPAPTVSLSLADAAFACRGGFVRLLDSPARPKLPVVRAFADACRFAVPDGAALLEQSGLAEPDRYRAAAEWLDAGSRYAGSSVFRRIDGAAERVESDYASSGQPLLHAPEIDADMAAWWSAGPDS